MKKQLLFKTFIALFIVINVTAQNVPNYIPTNGLVGWWPFNGNANDESGNGNNLLTVGNVTFEKDRFDKSNSVARFDELGEFFYLESPKLPSGNSPRTVSFWFNSTGVTFNEQKNSIPFTYGNVTQNAVCYDRFTIEIYEKQIYFHGKCSDYSWNTDSLYNSWIQLVYVYDPNNNKASIYKNGKLLDWNYNGLSTALNTPLGQLKIGTGINEFYNESQYNGLIDDVLIWDRCLSIDEINSLYFTTPKCQTLTATITSQGDTTFCQGGSVNLVATTGNNYTYQWYNNNQIINGANTSIYEASISGNYSVKITDGACDATSTVTSVVANPLPKISGTSSVCVGTDATFTVSSSFAVYNSWTSSQTSIAVVNSNTGVVTGVSPGTSLNVFKDKNGCYDSTMVKVNRFEQPTTYCGHSTSNSVTFNWNLVPGATSYDLVYNINNSQNQNVVGVTQTSYQLSGMEPGKNATITVTPKGTGCFNSSPNLTCTTDNCNLNSIITPQGNTTFCQGGSVNLVATTGNNYTYQWYNDNQVINGANTSIYEASLSGNYSVKITDGACDATSSATSVIVNSLPSIGVLSGDTNIYINSTSQFISTVPGGTWSSSNQTIASINNTGLVKGLSLGSSTIYYTVNQNGCTSIATKNIIVSQHTSTPLYTIGLGVTDIDGTKYGSVKIGQQEWMSSNLKVSKYNDGTNIPNVTDNTQWSSLSTGAWVYYNNDASNNNKYGKLYNWFAVSPTMNGNKNVCPTGWHVPTDTEWTILTDYVGGLSVGGGKLKIIDSTLWLTPNTDATNAYGFNAEPGGSRYGTAQFMYSGKIGNWWSISEDTGNKAWYRQLYNDKGTVYRSSTTKNPGLSIRCLKDSCVTPTASITPQSNTTFCQGGSVNLVATTGNNYTYQWYNDNQIINGANTSIYEASISGNYSVKITDGACNATSAAINVIVNPLPNVSLASIGGVVYKSGSSILLQGSPVGGTYNGEGVTNTAFNPALCSLGRKTITYDYTSPQGCSGQAAKSVIVADTVGNVCNVTKYDTVKVTQTIYDTVQVSITISDTVNILKIKLKLTTGIKANQFTSMIVYPNPTSDLLVIDAYDALALNGYKYRIVDIQGKEVYNKAVTTQKTEISLNTLGAKGVYILHILDANGTSIENKEIVLE